MKILVLNNLSIFSLFIAIVFRIINFKIKFLLIKQYFQNKRFLKFLSKIDIQWFNYQDNIENNDEANKVLDKNIDETNKSEITDNSEMDTKNTNEDVTMSKLYIQGFIGLLTIIVTFILLKSVYKVY